MRPGGDSPRLDFALRFVDGKGVLGLGDKMRVQLCDVDRFELRVPNLRFPFDVSGGVARFQSRRCDFGAADLSVDGARLQAWLDGRARLSRLGISQLRARLEKGRIELSARARVGDSQAALTARVTLEPAGGQRLIARIGDVRLYGFLPAPAPLIGLGIAVGLGAEPDGKSHALSVRGTGELSLNPLELLLWRTLPPAGWRLPRYRHAALVEATVDERAIVLRYGVGAAAPSTSTEPDEELRAAEALLGRGDLLGAAEAFGALAKADGDDVVALERQLAVLTALPARWPEAETIGARLIATHPERAQAWCALGAIEAERGLHATAAARYVKLAELAEAAGEREDARLAALRAGELLMRVSPKEAIPWLERTLATARDDVQAATLLCDAYAADGRWQDLLKLERWRLTQTEDPALEAEVRGRIARVWLNNLGDPVRARDELERALRGREGNANLWELYARALEQTGELGKARDAIGRAAAKLDGGARAELELRAATLAEAADDRQAALAHAQQALAAAPGHLGALERVASLLAALERLDEAVAAYQDAIDRAEEAHDDLARASLLVALAKLARDSLNDRHGARAYVERALAAAPTTAALELAAELAEEDGRLDDLERALALLADGGDRVARLKHAEVLGELDRWQEAASAAEQVATAFPARAYALLARAYAALGRAGELRAALEQLAQAGGAPTARIRLAELRTADGDLEGARSLLDDTLDGEVLDASDERRAVELYCDVLMRLGDDEALQDVLGRLAGLRDDEAGRARALAAQGAARARLGRLDDARQSYRAALAVAPADDDVQARVGLGEAAFALKRWDEARAALEPLYERGLPPRIERALRLGEIAERQGRADEAVPFYEAALQAGAHAADAVRAYNSLAGIFHARGDHAAEADVLLRAAEDGRTQESDAVRAGRLVAAADVLRKRGGQREQAAALYERALGLDPLQIVALDALESLATEAGDIERVAQVLGRKVAATHRRPAEQRAILGRLAALQSHLGRPDAARAAYARALEIDPSFRPALSWMAEDARARGAGDDELAALERLSSLPVDPVEPEALAPTLARLGELYAAGGRIEEAERTARRALGLMARHPTALAVLDEVLSRRPPSAELAELLAVRAEVETDFDVIVELLFRRAALLEGLGETRAAMQAHEQLIALRPSSAAAWNRLAALLRGAGEWPQLAQLLTRLAERHAADGRRAEAEALYVEIAHLAHDRLGDPERARAVLHKALEVEPKSKVALTSLLALARGRGDATEEDALLGRLGELADDSAARTHAVAERARARHARGDLDGALALLRELPPAASPDSALKLRVEIEEARESLGDAAAALEELRARAAAARDEAGERWAIRRLLRVTTAQRAQPSRASEELARRALELDPDDREAATVLYEVERARGNAPAQLAALEHLMRIARRTFEGPAREAELGIESAEVMARGGDSDAALARLREVLEVAPDNGRAHRAYGALLLASGRAADAARALSRAAELDALDGAGWVQLGDAWEKAGDGERAAAAFHRAGSAAPPKKRAEAAFRAGKTSDARAAAIEALAQAPRDGELLRWATHGLSPAATLAVADELVPRLGASDAAWLYATLAHELGAGSDEERIALERAAALSPTAEILVALGDRMTGSQAAARYESALALDSTCVEAALGLARHGDPYAAARALQTAWDATADAQQRARLSAARAMLLRDRLGDATHARQAIERALAEAEPFAELAPLRADLLRSQAALSRAAGDARAAEVALERLRADGAANPDDLRHLAELYAERGEHDAVVALLSPLPSSSDTLERALEATGRIDELASRLEAEAARKPPSEARTLYLRASQLAADRLADPRRAAALLERALPLGPADAEVWARLGRLYLGPLADPDRGARCLARAYAADRERADVLLPLADFHFDAHEFLPAADYYREALARFAVPADEAARVHLRLAQIAHATGDSVDEEQALTQALALGADQALPLLADLHRARGDGAKLAAVLLKQAEQTTGVERAALLREAVPHLPADDAARLDEQILLLDPSDEAARDRVLSRLRATGDAAALIARLEREIPRASNDRQAIYARELGRLAERVADEARAEAAWTTALAASPSLEAARALWEILGRAGRRAEAAPLFEAALEDPRLDAAERDELSRLVGEAFLQPGADAGRALAFVERARAAGQRLPLDGAAFRQLLRAERRFLDLVVALDAAATEARDPEERERLEREAAEVLERDLGHAGDAARRYAALFDQKPGARELATRARIAYAAANEPIYALAILDRELKLVSEATELAQLKIVRGELLLQAGADAEAEAEFLHALITTPRIGRAHAALADVYKKRNDLAGALEHLIAAADAPDLEPMRAAACAVDAADVLLVEGDSVTAERLYQLAAALDPADRRPVDALARLAAARGDHERHADLLGRAAALTADRRERARLALQRARLFQNDLKRDIDAYRAFKEAVACDPNLREAARALREMAETRGEWALAAEQRYRELALTTDAVERARLHVELAHLLEDKILDGAAALRNYEQAAELALDAGAPPDVAPWSDLVRLYSEAQRWRDGALAAERLAAALSATHRADQQAARAEALQRAGELHERAGDHERARQRLAEAAAIGGEAGRKADDSLLRIAEDEGDPIELRRRIEERLAVEPEGDVRLELLRRLLVIAGRVGDLAEVDARSQEILARAPDDAEAFVQRKNVLTARSDWAGLAQLLRARAAAVDDPAERAERRFEAGRLAESELYDVNAAANDYEAALGADPEHLPALDALADLAYRTRHLSRARALYAQLAANPSASSLGADEVWRRRGELAEEAGDLDEARNAYAQAVSDNSSNLSAHQALARLSLSRGDDAQAYQALRAVLDLLPLDAVERITELRRHLGELALKLGDRQAAQNYLELVLSQLPMEARTLELLARIYTEQQSWHEAADALGRLSRLVRDPAERAELLFRRGEVLRLGLGDLDSANDAYLKAADLHPTHSPTLRRLVAYYYGEGDFVALKEVTRELEALGQPLAEAATEAGLGLALGGDEARGTVVVAVAKPTAARLAELLAAARLLQLAQLDPALRASARALGPEGRATLQASLEALCAEQSMTSPLAAGARLALGRLHDAAGDTTRARVHYAVGAFVDPTGLAAARYKDLGPPDPWSVAPEELVHPAAAGPLRDALVALAPHVIGLSPSEIDADPAPQWTDRLRAVVERASGRRDFEACVVIDLIQDRLGPAWAEPTRPPRLLLPRRTLADESVARFAAARAMHLLVAGVALVDGRAGDDVAALLRAAATLFVPDLSLPERGVAFAAFVRAWQAELSGIALAPEHVDAGERERLASVLAAAVADDNVAAAAADYARAERLTADRVALAATGDLRAALTALAAGDATTPEARAAALAAPPLSDLVAFALLVT